MYYQQETIEALLRSLYGRIPVSLICSLLRISDSQLLKMRKKVGLVTAKRGSGLKVASFIWTYNESSFTDLPRDLQAHLKQSCADEIRKSVLAHCKRPHQANERHPYDVLYFYRRFLPSVVWREFYGFSEKFLCQISKAVGQKAQSGEGARLAKYLCFDVSLPDMPFLTASQIQSIEQILEVHRARYWADFRKQSEAHAAQILERMTLEAGRNKKPRVACRGRFCQGSWQREEAFFQATTDTPDGLMYVCKYCSYMASAERRMQRRHAGPEKKRKTRNLSKQTIERAGILLPKLVGKVPASYLRKLFDATIKQYSRLLASAGIEVSSGKGGTILLRWRLYDEQSVPKLSCLKVAERKKLVQIWQADQAEWIKAFEDEDALNFADMDKMEEQLKSQRSPVTKKGKIKCTGDCGKSRYPDPFFFPLPAGRFKHLCRYCNIRLKRKENHARVAGS